MLNHVKHSLTHVSVCHLYSCVKEANEAVKATSVVDLEHNVFPDLTDRNTGVVQTAAQAGMTRRSERKWALG